MTIDTSDLNEKSKKYYKKYGEEVIDHCLNDSIQEAIRNTGLSHGTISTIRSAFGEDEIVDSNPRKMEVDSNPPEKPRKEIDFRALIIEQLNLKEIVLDIPLEVTIRIKTE